MNTKETPVQPVMAIVKRNNRKKNAGNGKREKGTTIPTTIQAGILSFPLPPSDSMQLIKIGLQIQIVDMD